VEPRTAPAAFACPAVGSRSIYNYRGDAGAGSNTITVISESPGWRAARGDFNPANVQTLNVNNLTTDIVPGVDVEGIYFYRTGIGNNVVVNSDTTDGPNGVKRIIVNGGFIDSIFADSEQGTVTNHRSYRRHSLQWRQRHRRARPR
jgi:hypothetical protein